MPDKDAATPRVFLVRHGETAWTLTGQHTGKSDIPMTPHGEREILGTGQTLYGSGRLIDPRRVLKVWCSPRQRAIRTFELLSGQEGGPAEQGGLQYEITDRLAEWDYGLYDGLKTAEIRALRASHGLDADRTWDIWRDGCEEGEAPAQVAARIDALIADIRALQAPLMGLPADDASPRDVVLVAHGHLTRAFAKRWLGYPLDFPLSLMMQPGGVGVLSYQHHNVEEPALLLGLGFPLKDERGGPARSPPDEIDLATTQYI